MLIMLIALPKTQEQSLRARRPYKNYHLNQVQKDY